MLILMRKLLKSRWLLFGVYPSAVVLIGPLVLFLGYVWSHVWVQDLPGGRHGPLDAYRHTLASAVLSYVLDHGIRPGAGAAAVDIVCLVMENGELRSNVMDRHNNRLGSHIGARSTSFSAIEPEVSRAVAAGAMGATRHDQVTWLPERDWQPGIFW